MTARLISFVVLLSVSASGALASQPALSQRQTAELWREPADLERRDLLWGPGGRALAPSEQDRYTLIDVDKTGFSPGYDVRDGQGRLWSVKLGPESQTEVVVSRLLWAVGYHQPITYYLPRWTLVENGKASVQAPGRFRLEPPSQEDTGDWSWRENPFLETQPFAGLFVMMVMVNNWDLKSSQNAVYRVQAEGDDPRYLYAIKDLGASLGKTSWLLPGTRNDIEAFEQEPFIDRVEGNRVTFHYKGAWREPQLARIVTPADVRWATALLARLSSQQWSAAFRAAGYSEAEAARYIRRLQQKMAEGQAIG